jgi:hypothetical protein
MGASASCTEIEKLLEPSLPAVSVAVHVTRVTPSGKREPESGRQSGPVAIPELSLAVAAGYWTVAPVGPVAWNVMFAGTVRSGGVVSMVHDSSAAVRSALPAESVAATANV